MQANYGSRLKEAVSEVWAVIYLWGIKSAMPVVSIAVVKFMETLSFLFAANAFSMRRIRCAFFSLSFLSRSVSFRLSHPQCHERTERNEQSNYRGKEDECLIHLPQFYRSRTRGDLFHYRAFHLLTRHTENTWWRRQELANPPVSCAGSLF